MIKFIIARGIGFSPGSVKYIPTMGFAGAIQESAHNIFRPSASGGPRLFAGSEAPAGGNLFRPSLLNWDEIPGNIDDLGEFDSAGRTGRPKLFR